MRQHRLRDQEALQLVALDGLQELEGFVVFHAFGAHGHARRRYGPGSRTRTVTFLSLVAAQLLHALSCRHDRFVALGGRSLFGNNALNIALAGAVALQAVPILWPGFGRLLGIGPVRPADLGTATLSALASFGLNEAALALRSRRRQGPGAEEENADA